MANKEEQPVIVAFVLDYETGGLKCQTAACTQIAVHAVRIDTFERLGTFVEYIAPYRQKSLKTVKKRKVLKNKYEEEEAPLMDYEDKALEYSAITMDMLENLGRPLEEVAQDVLHFMQFHAGKTPKNMKPFIVGQNPEFDKGFFQQMIEYAGLTKEFSKVLRGSEDFYGNWQPQTLDTIFLGQLALCHNPNVNSYKLEIMCENLGIELDDAHDADADVTATTNVMAVLTQRMRSVGGTIESGEVAIAKTEKSRKHFKI